MPGNWNGVIAEAMFRKRRHGARQRWKLEETRRLHDIAAQLRFPRLIVYGILFGVECDGVVFAAAIQSKDPFNQPTKKILKDDTKFIISLENR